MTTAIAPLAEKPLPEIAEEAPDTGIRPYRWTVKEFYRAIDAKLFRHPDRLEILDGEIFEKMSPQLTPHVQATLLTRDVTAEALGSAGHARSQSPLDIGTATEPEPDVMVVKGTLRDYDQRKPKSEDVLLLVEVSDTTLGYDRHRKAAIYAEAGIEDYWILNLNARCLEVRRDPASMPESKYGYGYKTILQYEENEAISPLHAPDAAIRVSDLLPRQKSEE